MLLKYDGPANTIASIYFFDINSEETSMETDSYVYYSDSKLYNEVVEKTYTDKAKEYLKKIKRK
jgi:hypothetical protein